MAPLRPQSSRSSSRATSPYVDASEERAGYQSGRTPISIAAQASAQSLREASRPGVRTPSRSSSQPNLLRKKNNNNGSRPSSRAEAISEETPPLPPSHRPARTQAHPVVPSPLITTVSSSSESSVPSGSSAPVPPQWRKNSDENSAGTSESSDSAGRTKAATAAGAALAAQMGDQTPVMRQLHSRPISMSQRESDLSLTRQTTPRTVRDLGSDYTRYFNPFASRNNSQQDLSSPLPRYNSSTNLLSANGVSSTDLSNRLSNPFQDTKRYSNPFDSRPQTAPGTPQNALQKQPSPENEKKGGAAVGALPVGAAATTAMTPQKPGTPSIIRDADPEKAAFFPFMDDRLGAPEYAFPLFSDQKEDDDDLHMPQWDDDVKLKPKFKDHFTRENVVSTLGLGLMILGLLTVFVILPVVSYTTTGLLDYDYETPMSQMPKSGTPAQAWATVNNETYPLMQNIRTGLIDSDTPESAKTKMGANGDQFVLVFSDEFNAKNRTFYPGDDPYWFGGDFWYGATQDLEWYDPDAINTGDGTLQLQLDAFRNHDLDYRSGMLNSWNQLCFKGGIFEVSVSLPGPAGKHGLWPGVWTMGNLGRPGHLATTDGLWPYTYQDCDVGITPNQSSPDGISNLPGQRLPSCSCEGEDHPTPGTGRGAPEIDIIEVTGDYGGHGWATATQSFQVAPFDIFYYPNYEFMETPNYTFSFVNTYTGGPYQQAVSTTTVLNNEWYDGQAYQKYTYEYAPGGDENAYVAWTIGEDDNVMMQFDGRALGPNGNIGQRYVSEEPMSIIMNLGFSHSWVDVQLQDLVFPTIMRIDYVRWYQKDGEQMVTCDPPGFETTEYIANHPEPYNNPNLTHWSDAYGRPKNTLMDGCQAPQASDAVST